MTQHLGNIPEYGGSLRERPHRKAGPRARRVAAGWGQAASVGSGRRSRPEVSVTLVAPLVEDLLEAAEALSELLGVSEFPALFGDREGRCETEPVETVVRKEQL